MVLRKLAVTWEDLFAAEIIPSPYLDLGRVRSRLNIYTRCQLDIHYNSLCLGMSKEFTPKMI